jgi:hypothetical protein
LKQGNFSHFRPARYFSEHADLLRVKMPKDAKDRFEAAFAALNGLLK